MKTFLRLSIIQFIFLLVAPIAAIGATTNSISQWGVTWTFDKAYTYGTYANGDYWVLGPVTITSISPDFTGTTNGWEVNPKAGEYTTAQGFDSTLGSMGFNATLVPALPYTSPTTGTVSVVKAISQLGSSTPSYNPLKTVAVLTIVTAIPTNNGATVFRPPYEGINKPTYLTTSLQTSLLPTYVPTPSAWSLSKIIARFSMVQFGHISPVRGFRPTDNFNNIDPYGASVGSDLASGALGLMLNNATVAQKMPALIAYVQAGIDMYAIMQDGMYWSPGAGYEPNARLPMYFMAALFQDSTIIKNVQAFTAYTDDGELYRGKNGTVLFGDTDAGMYGRDEQDAYWHYITGGKLTALGYPFSLNASYRDPYGLIDGGLAPAIYQYCCLSQPWKGQALAVRLMPALTAIYTNPKHLMMLEYADRWVTQGVIALPDTCAPYDGNPGNYKVTYGPASNSTAANPLCILGKGRFPANNGNPDEGYYGSAEINEMWAAYRNLVPTSPSLLAPTNLQVN
ncbi:MAG: hypothetical protein RLZZ419_1677 [Pseudomonadota bacterium]|jgi:hypothetical protein